MKTTEDHYAAMRSLPSMRCDECGTEPTPSAYADDGEWHLYARCECERKEIELPWPFKYKGRATADEFRALGFNVPQ